MNVLISLSLSRSLSAHHRRYLERWLVGDGGSLVSFSFLFFFLPPKRSRRLSPLMGCEILTYGAFCGGVFNQGGLCLDEPQLVSHRCCFFSPFFLTYPPGPFCSNFWSASPSPTSWRPVSPNSCTCTLLLYRF